MSKPRPKPTPASKAFGQHIRSCRLVRVAVLEVLRAARSVVASKSGDDEE